MIKDSHLFYYVPGSYSNTEIDVAKHGHVAGSMDDNFKMASNNTQNVHYVTTKCALGNTMHTNLTLHIHFINHTNFQIKDT